MLWCNYSQAVHNCVWWLADREPLFISSVEPMRFGLLDLYPSLERLSNYEWVVITLMLLNLRLRSFLWRVNKRKKSVDCLELPMASSLDLQPPINEYKYSTFTYLHLRHLCFNTHSLAILPFSSPEQRLIMRTAFPFWVSPVSLPCQVGVIVTSGAVRRCLFTVYHLHNLTPWLNELCHPEEVCCAHVKVAGS